MELRAAAAGFHAGSDALLVTEHVIGGGGGVAIAVHRLDEVVGSVVDECRGLRMGAVQATALLRGERAENDPVLPDRRPDACTIKVCITFDKWRLCRIVVRRDPELCIRFLHRRRQQVLPLCLLGEIAERVVLEAGREALGIGSGGLPAQHIVGVARRVRVTGAVGKGHGLGGDEFRLRGVVGVAGLDAAACAEAGEVRNKSSFQVLTRQLHAVGELRIDGRIGFARQAVIQPATGVIQLERHHPVGVLDYRLVPE